MESAPPLPGDARVVVMAWWVALAGVVFAALLPIWLPIAVVGQDTPHHLLSATVLSNPERFAEWYDVGGALSSQIFVYLAEPFVRLGPMLAVRSVRTLGLFIFVLGGWLIGREHFQRHPVGALFAAAASSSFFTAMGFESFSLSIAIGLVAVGLGLRALRTGRSRDHVGFGATLLLTAFAHAIMAALAGVHLLLLALVERGGERTLERRIGGLILASLPAAALAVAVVASSMGGQAAAGFAEGLGVQRLRFADQAVNLWRCSFGGLSTLGVGPVAAILATYCIGGVLERKGLSSGGRFSAVATLAMTGTWLAVYFATPFHAVGWAFLQPRVLAIGVFACACAVPTLPWARLQIALAALAALAYLGTTTAEAITLGDELEAQVIRFGDGPPGRTMPVVVNPGKTTKNPYVMAAIDSGTYAVAYGGAFPDRRIENSATNVMRPRTVADRWPPHVTPYAYRMFDCTLDSQCVTAAARLGDRAAVQGLAYDTVLLIGDDGRLAETLLRRGYDRRAPARFVARPTSLRVRVRPERSGSVSHATARVGYPGTLGWFAQRRASGTPEKDVVLELGPLPAGPTAIEIAVSRAPGEPVVVLTRYLDLLAGQTVDFAVTLEP